MAMWKQVGVVLAVSLVGLGAHPAEARFGKRSRPQSSQPPSSPRPPSNGGGGQYHPNPFYDRGYYGYYGYGSPWYRYYYDPSWAWPYVGPGGFYRPFGRYYDLRWVPRRPPSSVREESWQPGQTDLTVDAGLVGQGTVVGVGLQVDGKRFGGGARLNVLSLATDDGSPGLDTIGLLSIKPSMLLVSSKSLNVRVSGGMDIAFAPDATFVGPGLGTSALLRVLGPIKLEASAGWTPFPFTQLTGDAGLGVDVGPVRLRGGYRAIYLSDQGRVEAGRINRELFAGPYAGVSLNL
jgi:hypothetical protein